MSVLIDNVAGFTVTEGLLDFVISENSAQYRAFSGSAVDGVEYAYKAKFSDGITAGYETGKGIYTSATNSISRTTIFTSSNANARVDFAPGQKFVALVSDKETIESEGGAALLSSSNTWTGNNTFTDGLQSTGAGTDSFRAGSSAGATTQGDSSVAIGLKAGETSQGNNGIIISSKGSAVDDNTAGHIHIASNIASLDYTNADGWSATDASGTFNIGPTVQKKVLTGSVTSGSSSWEEVLKLPMPNGISTTESWAGIGTLESLSTRVGGNAPRSRSYAQEFSINAFSNNTEITGSAGARFGAGPLSVNGSAVTAPPQLRVSTATGQTYLSVEVKGGELATLSSTTEKAFYSWADTVDGGAAQDHTAIIDQASLRAFGDTGALVAMLLGITTLPPAQQYDPVNGLLMRNGAGGTIAAGNAYSLESLIWTKEFLTGDATDLAKNPTGNTFDLSTTGFTMHYEVEKKAFDNAVQGGAVSGSALGLLFYADAAGVNAYLGFGKQSTATAWAGATGGVGVNVVTAQEPEVDQTHLNFDFSVSKVTDGYQLDVYIERTLWYSKALTNFPTDDLSTTTLHPAARAGYFHNNFDARIRNALIIKHPVDPYAGLTVSAIGVGDSNMTFPTLQGPDGGAAFPSRTAINNPLTTGQVDTVGLALGRGDTPLPGSVSGNVFLNSEMQAKGISVTDGYVRTSNDPGTVGSVVQRFFDASAPGWTILQNFSNDDRYGYQNLTTIVNDNLKNASTNVPPAVPRPRIVLSSVQIANGTFNVTCNPGVDLIVGELVRVTGTDTNSLITGYVDTTSYRVSALTNVSGSSVTGFTLVNKTNGNTIGTSVGTPSGLTFSNNVNEAPTVPTTFPKWWFCQMGINDLNTRVNFNPNSNGYPSTDDDGWVTNLCTTYLAQIDRMKDSSSDAKVFICSPPKMYSASDYTNPSTYNEVGALLNSKVNAEFKSRIANHSPGKVFFRDMYTNWRPEYHASPAASLQFAPGIHFNQEGYRQMALGFASIVPQGGEGETSVLRHRLTYDYNDISGIGP
jgi:hypothetical protein